MTVYEARPPLFDRLAADLADGSVDLPAATAGMVGALSWEEKIACLSGDTTLLKGLRDLREAYNLEPIVAGRIDRVGLPGIRFSDGPRGVVMHESTAFPVPMARGASFDPDLEARIGDAIGVEARTQGANLFAGVCINLLRHPAWGRAQETFGEDTFLLGEMGAALTRGAQRHVMACVKHFAANSMENSRFWVDVRLRPEDLDDLYLPHFERCIDAGAASVMSAYNRLNGRWCGSNRRLLTEILKERWGFDGFVMSDFVFGVRGSPTRSLEAGMDLEMPAELRFRWFRTGRARRKLSAARVDDAVTRLVRQQLRFSTIGEPDRYRQEAVAGPGHRALAREASVAGTVLLTNRDDALPIDEDVTTVAVIGRLADMSNTGDHGSSDVRAPEVITLLAGLREEADRAGWSLTYDDGRDDVAAADSAAGNDVAVVVVGYTASDEGEFIGPGRGGDREELTLRSQDEELIAAVAGRAATTIVIMMGGSAIITEAWRDRVDAVVMAWYPGMEGGHAIADVLTGRCDPGGRLPCTFPKAAVDLPPFKRFARRADYGPHHGYRHFIASRRSPAFWFGHGLSYGDVRWGDPTARRTDGGAIVAVEMTNLGERPGTEVVQVYAALRLGSSTKHLPTLVGFTKAHIEPGRSATAEVRVELADGVTEVLVGPSADPAHLTPVPL